MNPIENPLYLTLMETQNMNYSAPLEMENREMWKTRHSPKA